MRCDDDVFVVADVCVCVCGDSNWSEEANSAGRGPTDLMRRRFDDVILDGLLGESWWRRRKESKSQPDTAQYRLRRYSVPK